MRFFLGFVLLASFVFANGSALQKSFLSVQKYSDFATPVQKRAQPPKDRPIQIVTKSGYTLCYIPTFSIGAAYSSYVGILNCSVQGAIPARYDVFGRIGFEINKTWICITAPESVAEGAVDKDYLYLSPCAINLKTQQWKLKDNMFYSHDEFYSIKDDGSYLYAAHKFAKGPEDHKLHPSMQEWANTIAVPGNLSIATWIAWDLTDQYAKERYFLRNNQSDKNTTLLYYNLQSGHIADYDYLAGMLYCMYSNTGKQDWDWITWGLCDDSKTPTKTPAYFKPIPVSDGTFVFEDKDGNVLRLTRYGIHWGVPYTVSKSYIAKDTANSPTSGFVSSIYMTKWLRFIYANAGKNLHSCPAPGYGMGGNGAKKINLTNPPYLALPSDFTLSDAWINRLYAIDYTSDSGPSLSGVCGTCLLQAYQIIAELLQDPTTPPSSGGYFFDTASRADPFISFRARNSFLYATLNDILGYYNYPVANRSDNFVRVMDRAAASNISMLPQYNWIRLGESTNPTGINNLLQRMVDSPAGSVFLVIMEQYNPQLARLNLHAMVVLRLQSGAVAIPANSIISLQTFRDRLLPANSAAELRDRLTRFRTGNVALVNLGIFSVNRVYQNVFENIVSVSDCSGDGEDRRGSSFLPLPELVNQCASGRCEF